MAEDRAESVRFFFQRHADEPANRRVALSVTYWRDSRVVDLRRAITDFIGEPCGASTDLIRNGWALLPGDAVISGCQLTNGDVLTVSSATTSLQPFSPITPEDNVRVVHESGSQLGMAWPVNGKPLRLQLTHQGMFVGNAEEFDVQLTAVGHDDAIEIDTYGTVTVLINGAPSNDENVAYAGMLVRVERPTEGVDIPPHVEFRVVTAEEHDSSRRLNGVVAYRAPARESSVDVEAVEYKLHPPQKTDGKPFDYIDVLLSQASVLLMSLIFVFGNGFKLYYAALLFAPVILFAWRYRQYIQSEKQRMDEFDLDVASFDKQLGVLVYKVHNEVSSIDKRNPSISELTLAVENRTGLIWQRARGSEGFLKLRAATGTYESPSRILLEGAATDSHVSVWRKGAATAGTLTSAPLECDLSSGWLGFVGPHETLMPYMTDLLKRLFSLHSPSDLTVSCLAPIDIESRASLEWIAWLPHFHAVTPFWTGERVVYGRKACARALQEAVNLATEVDDSSARHLVIIHEGSGVNLADIQRLSDASHASVVFVWIGASETRLPDAFSKNWLRLRVLDGADIEVEWRSIHSRSIAADPDPVAMSGRLISAMACLVDETGGDASQGLTNLVPLANLVERPLGEQSSAWSSAKSLIASLGETTVGRFDIDFDESGPHLLIGGTTGSGKSELLRSMVLSLLSRYSSSDIGILLIDFKGGASLGEMKDAPQCIGMVSNLSERDVDRLVRFLERENIRRQEILAPFNGDYKKYRKEHQGLPRLVVVIDEFQGFMEGGSSTGGSREKAILNIASRGRSLGVHLVIATQSPRRVVTGEVRANVNGRIALRMIDESDSQQVIDSPQASRIHGSLRGRAYAMLESGKLIEFQSGLTETKVLGTGDDRQVRVEGYNPFGLDLQGSASFSVSSSGPNLTDAQVVLNSVSRWRRPTFEDQPVLLPSVADQDLPVFEASAGHPSTGGRVRIGVKDVPERQIQTLHALDLNLGLAVFEGESTTGRTAVLVSLATSFLADFPRGQVVAVDSGGGDLVSQLGESAVWAFDGANRGDLTLLLAQLLEKYEEPPAPTLVLFDRIDHTQETLLDRAEMIRLFTQGQKGNVYTAATRDTRIMLEPELRRAVKTVFSALPGTTGVWQEVSGDANLLRSYFLQPSAERGATVREPNRRPLGRLIKATRDDQHSLGHLGSDLIRHEPIDLDFQRALAVAGGQQSGRTRTLLTAGYLLARKSGYPIPVLLSVDLREDVREASSPWLLDVRHAWREWCQDGSRELVREFMEQLLVNAPVLLIDDLSTLESQFPLRTPDAPDNSQFGHFRDFVERMLYERRIRLIGTGALNTFYGAGMGSIPIARDYLHYTRELLYLQPEPSYMVETPHGFSPQNTKLVMNENERFYDPGEGTLVRFGRRTDISVRSDILDVQVVVESIADEHSY